MPTLSVEFLGEMYREMALQFGATEVEAATYARCYVTSNLRGKDTQGAAALPLSYRRLRNGAMRFGTPLKTVRDGAGFSILDGGHGVGQIVATRAMELAIEKARKSGVACVWAQNTNDFGMASLYAMLALEYDFVGLAMSNGIPLVAAWGGREELFSTNPLSLAVPANEEFPIVIDTSASAISHGKVIQAARKKERLPAPLIVDADGRITDDPVPFIVDPLDRDSAQVGAILPLGAKGFGWLLFVEIFSGLLSGMRASKDMPRTVTPDNPATLGQFFMAINVAQLMELSDFKARVDDLIRTIRASKRAEGFTEIRIPGERAAREAARREVEGIPVGDEEWRQITQILTEMGLVRFLGGG